MKRARIRHVRHFTHMRGFMVITKHGNIGISISPVGLSRLRYHFPHLCKKIETLNFEDLGWLVGRYCYYQEVRKRVFPIDRSTYHQLV